MRTRLQVISKQQATQELEGIFQRNFVIRKNDKEKKILDDIQSNPENFIVRFTSTTDKQKKKIFSVIADVLESKIGKESVLKKYLVTFETEQGYKSLPLTSEVKNKLVEDFRSNSAGYGVDLLKTDLISFSDTNDVSLPTFTNYTAFGIKTIYQKSTNNREGSFWPYLNLTQLDLKRYQIFDSLVDEDFRERPELKDCCFVYALQQTGLFTEDILNKIRLRIRSRMLNQSKIRAVCDDHRINLILHYIDDDATPRSQHQSRKLTNRSKNATPVEYQYTIEMNFYI
jgi:hypothetical protein